LRNLFEFNKEILKNTHTHTHTHTHTSMNQSETRIIDTNDLPRIRTNLATYFDGINF